jgi:hypothetical protein
MIEAYPRMDGLVFQQLTSSENFCPFTDKNRFDSRINKTESRYHLSNTTITVHWTVMNSGPNLQGHGMDLRGRGQGPDPQGPVA